VLSLTLALTVETLMLHEAVGVVSRYRVRVADKVVSEVSRSFSGISSISSFRQQDQRKGSDHGREV